LKEVKKPEDIALYDIVLKYKQFYWNKKQLLMIDRHKKIFLLRRNKCTIKNLILIEQSKEGFVSDPNVLEYKYSLDGLVEDVESGLKNTNDIGLVVAWESGELYERNYYIESLLIEENIGLRQYHGVTHRLRDISTNEYISELILLKDLILYLNDFEECMALQEKYDEQ